MNIFIFQAFCLFFILVTTHVESQSKNNTSNTEKSIIYRFEHNYLISEDNKKSELVRNKNILDTVQVSKRDRKKLTKALYSNDFSKILSEIVTVETKFEDN
jgi:hypothetical protein